MDISKGNAASGEEKIRLATIDMPGLRNLTTTYEKQQPLKGTFILGCVTPTPQTGFLILTLKSLGAQISWCSDNRFAADDDVVEYLRHQGIRIYAKSDMSEEEYFACMEHAIADIDTEVPLHILDDGCDITRYLEEHYSKVLNSARGITEQTTCGILALRKLYKENRVHVPSFDIDDCFFKKWFDNFYGIQESLRRSFATMELPVEGKKVTVFGYGAIGKGAALVLKEMGANVSIVESDLTRLVQARWDGYKPSAASQALEESDICLTATSCNDTISQEMIERHAHDSLYLGNIGHGTSEYDVSFLEKSGVHEVINEYIDRYTLASGKHLYSLCHGALVNFVAGGGNPSVVMSHTFTLTLLAHMAFAKNADSYPKDRISMIPKHIEEEAVERNYPDIASVRYVLSPEQRIYLDVAE